MRNAHACGIYYIEPIDMILELSFEKCVGKASISHVSNKPASSTDVMSTNRWSQCILALFRPQRNNSYRNDPKMRII